MGFSILGNGEVPVVPVLIGDEAKSIKLADRLLDEGVFSPSFRWPAVPMGQSRLRIVPMATHKKEHLDAMLSAVGKIKIEIK